jgi:hypothetical protein
MEMVTGFKAAEVLGKTPIEVLGFAEYAYPSCVFIGGAVLSVVFIGPLS